MIAASPVLPQPRRGQIWSVPFPSDPTGKGRRPVLIVSVDGRNVHPNASTVLVVPFSTTLTNLPTRIQLKPGETGLPETSELQPDNISTVRKETLQHEPGTRTLADHIIRTVALYVVFAMGLQPKDVQAAQQ